jgi:tetratricopeptide (TPR) repeat protein
MHEYAEKCILLNYELGSCHFYLGISKIYLKEFDEGKKEIKIAKEKGYYTETKGSLDMQADAYEKMKDYKNLAEVYENYIKLDYNNAQYHSSLAFVYSLIGEYNKARQEAMIVLELSPEAKENVDAFLKTLPY